MNNQKHFIHEKSFSLEAEVNLLGSIINKNSVMADVFGKVKPEYFYKDSHKLLYDAMEQIYLESGPIDAVTLSNKLGPKLVEAGGITYIGSIIGSAYFPQNASAYGDIICEKARNIGTGKSLEFFKLQLTKSRKRIQSLN